MKISAFLFSLALGSSAYAAAPVKHTLHLAPCEAPEALEGEIQSCTDNVLAEKAAATCRDALVSEWNLANAELSRVMSVAKKDGETKQQADFFNSHSDMQLAIDKLAELIVLTENAADRIARYPSVMIDNPYAGAGLVGSSNCFKTSYRAISKVVGDLDKKSDEGEDALAATDKLRGISQARDDGIATSYTHSIAGHRLVGHGSGSSSSGASDITGIQQDMAKQGNASESGPTAKVDHRAPVTHGYSAPALPTGPNPDAFIGALPASTAAPGLGTKLDPSDVFSGRGSLTNGVAPAVGDGQVPASPGDVGISSETKLLNVVIPVDTAGDGAPFTGEDPGTGREPASQDKTTQP